MKVLFVSGEFPPLQGGVGDYTRELGLALHDLGSQVHVVTSTGGGPVSGIEVQPIIERWNWSCWRAILDLVARQQPDVLHIQYQAAAYGLHPAINLLPRRLARLGEQRPRTVVTFHDLKVPYLFPKAGPLRRWVVNELARRSDAAITTNRADFESLKAQLGRPPALIPIGSNIAPHPPADYDRRAWRARWGLLSERQGPANPQLLFIGGRTGASDPTNVAYLQGIQALIAELGLAERVHWTGFVPPEEVSASFLAADICALPFRGGASFLHGTFHAALTHGAAIVTTRPRVPLPELADGDNVLLVPPEDPAALAEASPPGRRSGPAPQAGPGRSRSGGRVSLGNDCRPDAGPLSQSGGWGVICREHYSGWGKQRIPHPIVRSFPHLL